MHAARMCIDYNDFKRPFVVYDMYWNEGGYCCPNPFAIICRMENEIIFISINNMYIYKIGATTTRLRFVSTTNGGQASICTRM